MELLEAIRRRRTTNTPMKVTPLSHEHKRLLIEAAARVPSHFNSQPWRFVVVEDRRQIAHIAQIAGEAMRQLMEEGQFVARYRRYFRFSREESLRTGNGIYIDNVPSVLRPMVQLIFSEQVGSLLSKLGVAAILGNDQRRIVERSGMLLAITLDRQEYRPAELSGLYASITLGAVIQTLWLVTTALDIGMQFISTPLEIPHFKAQLVELLGIPPEYELVAIFRMGYRDPNASRNTIDWTSSQRKPFTELVHYERWGGALPPAFAQAPSLLWADQPELLP